jgi:GntR family transcriptional regulator/MocR family aminotransferase
LVVWFPDLPKSREADLLERARAAGVGVHSVSWLYASSGRPDCIGLVMGYAAVEPKLIARGARLLAAVIEGLQRTRQSSHGLR